jgi:hypothetical protein
MGRSAKGGGVVKAIPSPDQLDIPEAARQIIAHTRNPVEQAHLEAVLRRQIVTLRERAAKYPEDSWGIIETASALEVTNNPLSYGKVICMIGSTLSQKALF